MAAGAAAAFAFAPTSLAPALAVGLSPLLWMTGRSRGWPEALLLGWWFGLGHFAVGLSWIVESFANQPAVPVALGPPSVLALASLMAIYPAAACAITRKIGRGGVIGVLVFAAAWAGTEWLRGHLLTGFPWNPLSAVWATWPVMMQPLALFGAYGVSVFTALVAAAPAALAAPFGRIGNWPWLIAAGALLLLWAGYGAWRLEANAPQSGPGPMVRLVQPNIPQSEKWRAEQQRAHFADYLAMSGMLAPPDDHPLMVVWPETAVTDYYFDRRTSRRALASRMLPERGVLVTGAPRVIERTDGTAAPANSLMVLADDGRLRAVYDKHHLVPFGEYLPLRGLFEPLGVDKLTPGAADFESGPGPRLLSVPGLPSFSPLICYEVIFPGAVVPEGERPAFLLNITNDAWFGNGSGPHQHFAMARMRSVEEGLPLVRAAQTGISAVIDPVGRIVARIRLLTRGTADAVLPAPLAEPTPYALWGDRFFAALLFLVGLATIFARRGR